MHRLRKKYASSIVLFICLAAILLVGCQQTKALDQHPTLTWDTEGAHPSLKAFEALEGRRFDGKAFSVKWIDLYQIPDAGGEALRDGFFARIAIAPRYDMPLTLKSVHASSMYDRVNAYLEGSIYKGAKSLTPLNFSDYVSTKWEKRADMAALQLDIYFSNLSYSAQNEAKLQQEDFVFAFSNLQIEIELDGTKEFIEIPGGNWKDVSAEVLSSIPQLQELQERVPTQLGVIACRVLDLDSK